MTLDDGVEIRDRTLDKQHRSMARRVVFYINSSKRKHSLPFPYADAGLVHAPHRDSSYDKEISRRLEAAGRDVSLSKVCQLLLLFFV